MLRVANPIYDIVFKYIMEDERIAKTILSALLKKEILEVEVRRHEYTNGSRDKISMFRIDFGAKIKEEDGSERLILIELQKTWLETETLRFRQYLGAQYANPDNLIKEDNPEGYGLPMVTVYLLGHKLGDIEESVLYVTRKSYNYDGTEVTKGLPNPFIESLTHDSIIVQIPRLKGHFNNRLEKVLSIFDQSRKDSRNRQILDIEEEKYNGDKELMHMIHRLLSAASDAELRQTMNVEDEYFSAIENRDTAIMLRDKKIEQQDILIAEQIEEIATKNEEIATKNEEIATKNEEIATKNEEIATKNEEIAEQNRMLRSTIQLLFDSGLSIETIAVNLNIDIETVKRYKEM